MLIAWIHFLANLIIALALLRVIEATLIDHLGPDHPLAKALAFVV